MRLQHVLAAGRFIYPSLPIFRGKSPRHTTNMMESESVRICERLSHFYACFTNRAIGVGTFPWPIFFPFHQDYYPRLQLRTKQKGMMIETRACKKCCDMCTRWINSFSPQNLSCLWKFVLPIWFPHYSNIQSHSTSFMYLVMFLVMNRWSVCKGGIQKLRATQYDYR